MSPKKKDVFRPKVHRLLEHSFVFSVLGKKQKVSEVLSKQAKEAYELGQEPKYSFTPEMAYHHNVNHYLTNLLGTVERIAQVPIFLKRFPNSKFFAENNITLHKWVNYHYTNFLIMSVSLYDISLLLTNEIFVLGIEPRKCNEKTVAKHEFVKKTSVKISLDNLAQAIDEYRTPRHQFVHRGYVPSMGFMDRLDSFDFLQKAEKELGIKLPDNNDGIGLLSNPIIVRDLYKIERGKLIKEIEQKTDFLVEVLFELFNSQQTIYDAISKHWES
jgi:hypothetical protein